MQVETCIECGDAEVSDVDTEVLGPDGDSLGRICEECEGELLFWAHEERHA